MSEVAQVWGARIDWQQRSGRTVAECCEAEGVSTASFYRWRKLLTDGRTARSRRTARRTTPQASAAVSSGTQFLPIELRESLATPDTRCAAAGGNGSSSVRIELPNGVVIHVPGDLDGQRLGDVILAAGQIAIPSSPMSVRGIRQPEAASC